MSDEQYEKHENLCERCGRCCQKKLGLGEDFYLAGACPFFDKDKGCIVYERRFQVNPRCRTVLQAMTEGLLPEDCPYVRDFPGYHSCVKEWQTKGKR